jgi:signal transduction histidine kinase
VAVGLLGLAVTLGACLFLVNRVLEEERLAFSWTVEATIQALRSRIDLIAAQQAGFAETLSLRPPRTTESFERMATRLGSFAASAAIRGIGYSPRVPEGAVAEWVKAIRAEARPGSPQATLEIKDWAPHPGDHYPALFIIPDEPNRALVGDDILQSEGHGADLDRLLARGDRVAVSGPLRFDLATHGGRPAVLVIAPIYEPDGPLETEIQRRRVLRGVLLAGLGVDKVLSEVLDVIQRPDMVVHLFDQGPATGPLAPATRAGLLLDTEMPLSADSVHALPDATFGRSGLEVVRVLDVGGRHWGVYLSQARVGALRDHAPLLLLPLFGVVLTSLAVVMVLRAQQTAERLEDTVAQRTGELVESHRALSATVAELEASHQDLRQYARLAAHDLSEPSRGIVSFAQLLHRQLERGNALDRDAEDFIIHLERAALHMRGTVDGFAAYTQVVAADPTIALVRGEALSERVAWRLSASERDGLRDRLAVARLTWTTMPDLMGDAQRLEDALFHLARNALTYVPPDRVPEVSLGARLDGEWWIFEARDNGMGIPKEEMARLTEPFARGRRDITLGVRPGPGVGLAIARRVAERHGGRLELEAAPNGEGLVARLTVPRGDVDLVDGTGPENGDGIRAKTAR